MRRRKRGEQEEEPAEEMDKGASSSSRRRRRRRRGGGGGGGGGGGSGETVVSDCGRSSSHCVYCRSPGSTSLSYVLWAHSLAVDDYQELLDRGWMRCGLILYKPDMERTCCPSYTIRLKAAGFVPSKEQRRVDKKMQRFLDGKVILKSQELLKGEMNHLKGLCTPGNNASSQAMVSEMLMKRSSANKSEVLSKEDRMLHYLSSKIDDAVNACIQSGDIPSIDKFPKAAVKRKSPQAKKKLVETPEDLLYTSSISFRIAAELRWSHTAEQNCSQLEISKNATSQTGDPSHISSDMVAEMLACLLDQQVELSGLKIRACNGHLNFYTDMKQVDPDEVPGGAVVPIHSFKRCGGKAKQCGLPVDHAARPNKKYRLDVRLQTSSFEPEEYALYKKYQIRVHNDEPDQVTESSYRNLYVDTPLVFIPPDSRNRTVPPCGFGSFHQQYLLDGKLVAVGVVDILPRCLSSKYLFWDPDLAFLSLGKYSALKEIEWVKQTKECCPSLQYYYLGYYIHSCDKMRYKAAYQPSELLCPLRYEWVPFKVARPLLGKRSYVILSDHVTVPNGAASPSDGNSNIPLLNDTELQGSGKSLGGKEGEMESNREDLESGLDDEVLIESKDTRMNVEVW